MIAVGLSEIGLIRKRGFLNINPLSIVKQIVLTRIKNIKLSNLRRIKIL